MNVFLAEGGVAFGFAEAGDADCFLFAAFLLLSQASYDFSKFSELFQWLVVVGRFFGVLDNAGGGFYCLERVFADGGFVAKHDGVGAVNNGVGYVGDFGAGGAGFFHHGSEHLGGYDDGFFGFEAFVDDFLLQDHHFFLRHFDGQVPAGDHDGVGFVDDGVQVLDGFSGFNFGDYPGVSQRAVFGLLRAFFHLVEILFFFEDSFDVLFEALELFSVGDEGGGNKVHALGDDEFQVFDVFVGEESHVGGGFGDVNTLVGIDFSSGDDFGHASVFFLVDCFQFFETVFDEYFFSHFRVLVEAVPVENKLFFEAVGMGAIFVGYEDFFFFSSLRDLLLATRMRGPWMSAMMPTLLPASLEALRMFLTVFLCQACSPWEKLRRHTSMPASIIFLRVAVFSEAGPMVAVILVFFIGFV